MSDIAIRVDGLGKRYAIGAAARQSGQPRRIFDLLESLTGPQWSREETFWALQDVSFEIKHGEIVGVVGGNGAGKSTLLKILSRIVQPTAGCAEIHGRMGSLLEVGTGFHPDLTGRENIFMSGVMLGMRRSEVQRRFDEIVAFSGVERFLDTPIKRYSSGMQTRLGFSVAAYLEAEVLLIDEVLAVGDDEFQKRCLGKMKEVAVGGRTVLFISHNMNSVQALCTRAIWLDKGRLRADSTDVRHVAHEYLSGDVSSARGEWVNTSPDLNEAFIIPLRIRLIDPNGVVVSMPIANNVELTLELDVDVRQLAPGLIIGYILYAEDGQELWCSGQTDETRDNWPALHQGRLRLKTTIPPRLLNEGRYTIECVCGPCDRSSHFVPGARAATIQFEIQGGLSDSPYWTARRSGFLAPVRLWRVAQSSTQAPYGDS